MREQFIEKRFGVDARDKIQTINQVLAEYEAQNYRLTLRQLYYQFVSRGLVENTVKSYKNFGALVSDARLAGLIDWNMIQDRGREMTENPHWQNPKHFAESVATGFMLDLWEGQGNYVEVMIEKDALSGVLEPVCRALDIPFTANRGYSSSSTMYEASKRFLAQRNLGKNLHVIYLGDHDPSGIDMTRDVEERLHLFIGSDDLYINRVALNMPQVEELNPPENPAKTTDSRAKKYIKDFGHSSWELDAIEPKMLGDLVRNAVFKLLNVKLFQKRQNLLKQHRITLVKFAKTM